MLSKLTLANSSGEDIVLHDDTATSKRLAIEVKGLTGIGALRSSKRVKPSAHGSINETQFEEGRSIQMTGEVFSTLGVVDMLEEWRKVVQVMLESLDNGGALLKWTEGSTGLKLQMEVTVDSDVEPIEKEAAAALTYPVTFFAEDPRAYSQTVTTQTSTGITGSAAENTFSTATKVTAIAIDATFIYFGEEIAGGEGQIGRCKLNGTSVETGWVKGLVFAPLSMAVDANFVYFSWGTQIGRVKVAGTGLEQEWLKEESITTGFKKVAAFAIDATHIYWAWEKHIGRAAIAGTSIEKEWVNTELVGNGTVCLAVSSTFVYYGNASFIGRCTITGAEINNNFVSVGSEPQGLTVSSTFIYWTTGGSANSIGRAKLAGTEVLPSFITGAVGPTNVTVNSEHIYWCDLGSERIGRSASLTGAPSTTLTVTQSGNRPTPLVFKVHGPVTNPVVVRSSDGSQIALNGTIGEGNYVELDTAKRTARLNGVANVQSMVNAGATDWSAFSPLAAATYILTCSSATAAFMEILYRSAYA